MAPLKAVTLRFDGRLSRQTRRMVRGTVSESVIAAMRWMRGRGSSEETRSLRVYRKGAAYPLRSGNSFAFTGLKVNVRSLPETDCSVSATRHPPFHQLPNSIQPTS